MVAPSNSRSRLLPLRWSLPKHCLWLLLVEPMDREKAGFKFRQLQSQSLLHTYTGTGTLVSLDQASIGAPICFAGGDDSFVQSMMPTMVHTHNWTSARSKSLKVVQPLYVAASEPARGRACWSNTFTQEIRPNRPQQ